MVRSRISCFKRRLVFGAKAPVEKTGQITSYSATGGEDGDLQKGVK